MIKVWQLVSIWKWVLHITHVMKILKICAKFAQFLGSILKLKKEQAPTCYVRMYLPLLLPASLPLLKCDSG